MEAPTTLCLQPRVGERHLAAARQNLPRGKAVPSQYLLTQQPIVNSYENLLSDNRDNQQNIVANKILR